MKLVASAIFLLAAGVFLYIADVSTGATEVTAVVLLLVSLCLSAGLILVGLRELGNELIPDEEENLFSDFLASDDTTSQMTEAEQRVRFQEWKGLFYEFLKSDDTLAQLSPLEQRIRFHTWMKEHREKK